MTILGWLFFSVAAGMFAHIRRNRHRFRWFGLAVVLSPLVAFVLLAILRPLPYPPRYAARPFVFRRAIGVTIRGAIALSKGGGDGPENRAASCSPCNTFKKNFDPASAIAHSNPSREEKIEAARKYIEQKKKFYRDRLDKIREIVASEQAGRGEGNDPMGSGRMTVPYQTEQGYAGV